MSRELVFEEGAMWTAALVGGVVCVQRADWPGGRGGQGVMSGREIIGGGVGGQQAGGGDTRGRTTAKLPTRKPEAR